MIDCNTNINKPEVDNTPEVCVPIDAKCVIYEEAIVYLGLPADTDVDTIIKELVCKLKAHYLLINSLESRIKSLESA